LLIDCGAFYAFYLIFKFLFNKVESFFNKIDIIASLAKLNSQSGKIFLILNIPYILFCPQVLVSGSGFEIKLTFP